MAWTGVAVVNARGALPAGHPLALDKKAAARALDRFLGYRSLCEADAQRQLTRQIEGATKATAN